jgi:hypothetical protein
MRANLRDLAEAAAHDPAQAIWDAVGDLGDYEPFHNRLLCATYVPPNKVITRDDGVKVEIHRADRSLMEERFQGKAALVLKMGPQAFREDATTDFGGIVVKPGEWVIFQHSNAYEVFLRDRRKSNEGISCWLVQDVFIEGRVSDPSLIY